MEEDDSRLRKRTSRSINTSSEDDEEVPITHRKPKRKTADRGITNILPAPPTEPVLLGASRSTGPHLVSVATMLENDNQVSFVNWKWSPSSFTLHLIIS